jgi:hypothetical protein
MLVFRGSFLSEHTRQFFSPHLKASVVKVSPIIDLAETQVDLI